MDRPFRCARRRPPIHKPSKAVSFGLPDRLSICACWHAMVAADRGRTPTGKRQGQAATRPDPPSFGKCNGCEDEAPTGKTQEIKGEPDASLCGIDVVGGRAKPDQYGCRMRYLGDGVAWAAGSQAFLRPATFACEASWNFAPAERRHWPTATGCFGRLLNIPLIAPVRLRVRAAIGVTKPFSRCSKSS